MGHGVEAPYNPPVEVLAGVGVWVIKKQKQDILEREVACIFVEFFRFSSVMLPPLFI